MKYCESLNGIVYEKLCGEDGIIEKIYGDIPDIDFWFSDNKRNEIEVTNEATDKTITIKWKREIDKGKEYIEIDLPEKLFDYPMRNYKCLDLKSLKQHAKETKARTVQSFLLELGLMEEELNDAKKICEFDLNKDPRKLTSEELAQFHLIKTRRDF
jgi:hypothetical protein